MAVAYDFSGRTAVVVGGAGGIGRAVVRRLGSAGARVWSWDIVPLELPDVRSVLVDVTQGEQIAGAVSRVLERDGRLDILIHTVGYLGGYVPFSELDPSEWRRVVELNMLSVLEVSRQVIPHMRRAGWGRIVNMGSLAGKEGLPNLAVYSAASAGVIAFTKALAKELADTGIRVNCVTPGPIATEMIRSLGQEVVKQMVDKSPLHRLGTAEEVAELVVWLCSEACSFSTGAVFDVSGGRAGY
jgi:3-oxoacyl-[acyl-carrier protein] reductase